MSKRIKRVFNTAQACHVWAAQTQDNGRNSQGNVFFEGTRIWSYGSHYLMGQIYPNNIVLINEYSYSSTTSQHRSKCTSAVSHLDVFYVSDPGNIDVSLADMGDKLIAQLFEAFTQLRPYINLAEHFDNYNNLCLAFHKPGKMLTIPADLAETLTDHILHRRNRGKELEQAKELKEAASRAASYVMDKLEEFEQRKEDEANLVAWLKGENVGYYEVKTGTDLEMIRVKNDKVETTGGADVPLKAALNLLDAITSGAVRPGDRVGAFEFNAQDGDIITIGCHDISLAHARSVLNRPSLKIVN